MSYVKSNGVLTINNCVIEVCLKRQTIDKSVNVNGLENTSLYFKGNVVKVKDKTVFWLFPNSIDVNSLGFLTLDNASIVGEFRITDLHRTRFKAIERNLGQYFEGLLIPNKPTNLNNSVSTSNTLDEWT